MRRLTQRDIDDLLELAARGGLGRATALNHCVAEGPDQLMYIQDDTLILLRDAGDDLLAYCEGEVGWVKRVNLQFDAFASTSTAPSSPKSPPTPHDAAFATGPPTTDGPATPPHVTAAKLAAKGRRMSGPFELDSSSVNSHTHSRHMPSLDIDHTFSSLRNSFQLSPKRPPLDTVPNNELRSSTLTRSDSGGSSYSDDWGGQIGGLVLDGHDSPKDDRLDSSPTPSFAATLSLSALGVYEPPQTSVQARSTPFALSHSGGSTGNIIRHVNHHAGFGEAAVAPEKRHSQTAEAQQYNEYRSSAAEGFMEHVLEEEDDHDDGGVNDYINSFNRESTVSSGGASGIASRPYSEAMSDSAVGNRSSVASSIVEAVASVESSTTSHTSRGLDGSEAPARPPRRRPHALPLRKVEAEVSRSHTPRAESPVPATPRSLDTFGGAGLMSREHLISPERHLERFVSNISEPEQHIQRFLATEYPADDLASPDSEYSPTEHFNALHEALMSPRRVGVEPAFATMQEAPKVEITVDEPLDTPRLPDAEVMSLSDIRFGDSPRLHNLSHQLGYMERKVSYEKLAYDQSSNVSREDLGARDLGSRLAYDRESFYADRRSLDVEAFKRLFERDAYSIGHEDPIEEDEPPSRASLASDVASVDKMSDRFQDSTNRPSMDSHRSIGPSGRPSFDSYGCPSIDRQDSLASTDRKPSFDTSRKDSLEVPSEQDLSRSSRSEEAETVLNTPQIHQQETFSTEEGTVTGSHEGAMPHNGASADDHSRSPSSPINHSGAGLLGMSLSAPSKGGLSPGALSSSSLLIHDSPTSVDSRWSIESRLAAKTVLRNGFYALGHSPNLTLEEQQNWRDLSAPLAAEAGPIATDPIVPAGLAPPPEIISKTSPLSKELPASSPEPAQSEESATIIHGRARGTPVVEDAPAPSTPPIVSGPERKEPVDPPGSKEMSPGSVEETMQALDASRSPQSAQSLNRRQGLTLVGRGGNLRGAHGPVPISFRPSPHGSSASSSPGQVPGGQHQQQGQGRPVPAFGPPRPAPGPVSQHAHDARSRHAPIGIGSPPNGRRSPPQPVHAAFAAPSSAQALRHVTSPNQSSASVDDQRGHFRRGLAAGSDDHHTHKMRPSPGSSDDQHAAQMLRRGPGSASDDHHAQIIRRPLDAFNTPGRVQRPQAPPQILESNSVAPTPKASHFGPNGNGAATVTPKASQFTHHPTPAAAFAAHHYERSNNPTSAAAFVAHHYEHRRGTPPANPRTATPPSASTAGPVPLTPSSSESLASTPSSSHSGPFSRARSRSFSAALAKSFGKRPALTIDTSTMPAVPNNLPARGVQPQKQRKQQVMVMEQSHYPSQRGDLRGAEQESLYSHESYSTRESDSATAQGSVTAMPNFNESTPSLIRPALPFAKHQRSASGPRPSPSRSGSLTYGPQLSHKASLGNMRKPSLGSRPGAPPMVTRNMARAPVSHRDFADPTVNADGMEFQMIRPGESTTMTAKTGAPEVRLDIDSSDLGLLAPEDLASVATPSSAGPDQVIETDEWGFLKNRSPTPAIFKSRQSPADVRAAEQKWLTIIDKPLAHGQQAHKRVRRMVIEHGVPASVRGPVWQWHMGNGMSGRVDGLFQRLVTNEAGPFDEQIDRDVATVFSDHAMFANRGGNGQRELRKLLRAYVHFAPNGYYTDIARIGGALLIHAMTEDAFWLLAGLFNGVLKTYYAKDHGAFRVDLHVFQGILQGSEPKVAKLLRDVGVAPHDYLQHWWMSVFVRSLPWPTVLRVFDAVIFEGPRFLLISSLAILTISRDRLLALPRNATSVLKYLHHLPQDSLLLPDNFMRACDQVKLRDDDLKKLRVSVKQQLAVDGRM